MRGAQLDWKRVEWNSRVLQGRLERSRSKGRVGFPGLSAQSLPSELIFVRSLSSLNMSFGPRNVRVRLEDFCDSMNRES